MRQLDLFSSLQSSTEDIDAEFKSARSGLPGSFWESYAAFANTQGGTIALGVAEKRGELVWEGVPDAAQLRTVLWAQLNDRNKISANLLRDDDARKVCCFTPVKGRRRTPPNAAATPPNRAVTPLRAPPNQGKTPVIWRGTPLIGTLSSRHWTCVGKKQRPLKLRVVGTRQASQWV